MAYRRRNYGYRRNSYRPRTYGSRRRGYSSYGRRRGGRRYIFGKRY